MKKIGFFRRPLGEKITFISFLLLFIVSAFLHIFPFIWSFINSLKTGAEFFESNIALPKEWRFNNFIRVFSEFRYRDFTYFDMLFNSLWMLVVNVFVNVMSSAMLAYAVARFRFPGKNFLYAVVIFANTIPIIGSGPAKFKLMAALGMVNNPGTIWLSWASAFDFAFIVFYGTFKGISMSYSESAKIDGANNLTVLFRIVFPQAMPSIIAIAITQSIGVWNNYGTVMIYLREFPNLAYGLFLFNTESIWLEDSKPIFFAATFISSIPVIVLYAANQKLILTNVTAGGLKG